MFACKVYLHPHLFWPSHQESILSLPWKALVLLDGKVLLLKEKFMLCGDMNKRKDNCQQASFESNGIHVTNHLRWCQKELTGTLERMQHVLLGRGSQTLLWLICKDSEKFQETDITSTIFFIYGLKNKRKNYPLSIAISFHFKRTILWYSHVMEYIIQLQKVMRFYIYIYIYMTDISGTRRQIL